jgi:hypothetical protein
VCGFGLAHIKKEGAPLHPDDMFTRNDGRYQRQLKAYNDYFKIPVAADGSKLPDYSSGRVDFD